MLNVPDILSAISPASSGSDPPNTSSPSEMAGSENSFNQVLKETNLTKSNDINTHRKNDDFPSDNFSDTNEESEILNISFQDFKDKITVQEKWKKLLEECNFDVFSLFESLNLNISELPIEEEQILANLENGGNVALTEIDDSILQILFSDNTLQEEIPENVLTTESEFLPQENQEKGFLDFTNEEKSVIMEEGNLIQDVEVEKPEPVEEVLKLNSSETESKVENHIDIQNGNENFTSSQNNHQGNDEAKIPEKINQKIEFKEEFLPIQNFANNKEVTFTDYSVFTNESSAQFSSQDVTEQIITYLRTRVTPETKEVEISLQPETLGKININLQQFNERGIIARFSVQSEIVKEIVNNQIPALLERFEKQNIYVSEIQVILSQEGFGSFSDEQQREDKKEEERFKNGRQTSVKSQFFFNLIDESKEEMLSEDEKIEAETLKQQGTKVNYRV